MSNLKNKNKNKNKNKRRMSPRRTGEEERGVLAGVRLKGGCDEKVGIELPVFPSVVCCYTQPHHAYGSNLAFRGSLLFTSFAQSMVVCPLHSDSP